MIEVEREPSDVLFGETLERCVFCNEGTRFWHLPTNYPVCESCAAKRMASELPRYEARRKEIAAHRAKFPV